MSTDPVLLREKNGAVATLTFNRPKQFNALNEELRADLLTAIKELDADDDVRVVILKGAGRGFCAGADLAAGFVFPVSKQLDEEYKPPLIAIGESPKIWIAQVHGSAAGIGAAFAMNCDLMTMADDANLYMAFAAIALIPDGGNTQLLLQNMGYHRALEAILEGEKISASDCKAYSIANKLAPAADLDANTMEWAQSLASGAPLAMAAAKRLLRKVGSMNYGDAISTEGLEQDDLQVSADCKAGIDAFFAKEKPIFKGE